MVEYDETNIPTTNTIKASYMTYGYDMIGNMIMIWLWLRQLGICWEYVKQKPLKRIKKESSSVGNMICNMIPPCHGMDMDMDDFNDGIWWNK